MEVATVETAKEWFNGGNTVEALKMTGELSVSLKGKERKLCDHLERWILDTLVKESIDRSKIVRNVGVGSEDFRVMERNWKGLTHEERRSFMQIRIQNLRDYVLYTKGEEAVEALDRILRYAKKNKTWFVWGCRSCSKLFAGIEGWKNHIKAEHVPEFIQYLGKNIPQMMREDWGDKVAAVGSWEPVDAVAALQKIESQEMAEVGVNDWPLAADVERRDLLKEIGSLLVFFKQQNVLTDSVRDRVMHLVANHVKVFENMPSLVETPQSICFLECRQLEQLLGFLRKIKYKIDDRNDLVDLVSRAVECSKQGFKVREKTDYDTEFSFLLLDKRLLRGSVDNFDNGKIKCLDPTRTYANIRSQRDSFLKWLNRCFTDDDGFVFPRTHNFGLWLALLRALHFNTWSRLVRYEKKSYWLEYIEALSEAKKFCQKEIEGKLGEKDLLERLLRKVCEKSDTKDNMFLGAVRDILCGGTSGLQSSEAGTIRELKVNDETITESTECLEATVREKVCSVLIDILEYKVVFNM